MRASALFYQGLVLALLCVTPCSQALGCGCMPPPGNLTLYELVKQSVERADLVFVGVPVVLHGDGRSEDAEDLVVFDVTEIFKGERAKKIGIHSGIGLTHMSSCGYEFEVGKTYLVFANHPGGGSLMVAACSFTAPIEKSGVALRFLRKEQPEAEDLLTPTQVQRKEKGRILGTVRRSDDVALYDPKVYIWNDSDPTYEKAAWFTRAKKDGSFESYFLSPGTYRVTAVDSSEGPIRWVGCYSSHADDDTPAKVDVAAGRDYQSADIVLHQQKVFSVQGVVRSSDDSPLPFAHVEIRVAMAPTETFSFLAFVAPHADGTFYVPRVPVGIARLRTYVNKFDDPKWETSVSDVEVRGDVENVEIVLKRKAGGNSEPRQ